MEESILNQLDGYEDRKKNNVPQDNIPQHSELQNDRSSVKQVADTDVDPYKIQVNLPSDTPIVILFGPASSGKSMALVRLARYLNSRGYSLTPNPSFWANYTDVYAKKCNGFDDFINTSTAVNGNGVTDFMLVDVSNRSGRCICRILDAPGEHFFNQQGFRENGSISYPPYLNKIFSLGNQYRKWVFIAEPGWNPNPQPAIRSAYINAIARLKSNMGSKDRVIVLCSKSDLHSQWIVANKPNIKQFYNMINLQYPGLFNIFVNNNPVSWLFGGKAYEFIPFVAGTFEGLYTPSNDVYPARLWQAIY